MSQPQQAGQQAVQQLYQDLLNELAFQRVLLKSIDDTVEDREEAEKEVATEIRSLETQLRSLKKSHGTTSTASSSASRSSKYSALNSMENHLKPSAFASAHQGSGSSSGVGSSSSTASTPSSNMDSLPDIVSPVMALPTRKRSHSKHLDNGLAPFAENKSRRTSPNPYMGAMTPMSDSGDEFPDPLSSDFLNKLQKAEEDKAEQEKQDAEFARQLQDENSFASFITSQTSNPPSSSSSRAPNAFDRMHNGRPQSYGLAQPAATGHSKLPWAKQSGFLKSEGSSNDTSNLFSPGLASSASYSSAYKAAINPSRYSSNPANAKPSSTRAMPGSFIDDSDSDIEVIDATHFHDNGRHSRPSTSSTNQHGSPQNMIQRPGFLPESQAAGDAAPRFLGQGSNNDALRMAMFGEQEMPDWLRLPHPEPPMTFSSPPSTSMGMQGRSPFVNLIENAGINGSGIMHSSMGMQHPGPGLGYTLNNLPTYGQGYNSQPFSGSLGSSNTLPFGNLLHRTGAQIYESMAGLFGSSMTDGMAEQVDYIINDPRKTTEEIKALLENIQPDVELPAENREGTPDGMKYNLYEHQKIALTWLKTMEEGTNKGGILADDMGLGKTISSIALILSRPSTDRARKTTLIVGPVALVRQWDREVGQKVRCSHRLATHMVHGPGKKLSWSGLRVFDVVFTTYGTLGAELKRLEKWKAEQNENGLFLDRDMDQAAMERLFPLLGPNSLFYRVILDEAQCIKNKSTVAARAACELRSLTRFCLTGTPMMNNVSELYSLIRFLRIKPYNDVTRFKYEFGMLTKGDATQGDVAKGMRKLQAVLKAIMLRRLKGSLIDGKPIITLPPKTEEIQHVVFSEDEQAFYNSLESKTRVQFNKYMRSGTVGKNYSNILVLLLRLRQCCCHPHLITDFDEAPPAGASSEETMMQLAQSLDRDVVGRILAANGSFSCPVCYDAVLNPSIVVPCGHDTCSECLVQIVDRSNQQNVANGEEGGGLRCPSCRGKIEMTKIIDYSSFKKVHIPGEVVAVAADDEETASENDDSEDDSGDSDAETESESDADENGDLRNFIVPDFEAPENENEDDADPIEDVDGDDEVQRPSKRKSKSKAATKTKEEKRRRKVKQGKTKEKKQPNQPTSMALLKKEASKSIENRRRYMRYLRKHWQPSAKVVKCVDLLEQFQNDGQKTIVFSQFVTLLDLLQVPIDGRKWKCERYDGGMNADHRNDAINRFTDDPNINIMLISLKAGNAGLNLVAASRVIILDPFWNPYIEMQAIDRAHRIGQQRPVEVHRILIEQTVEDRIIELQESKKKLVNAALDENASSEVSRLGERELAFLFGVGGI